jgi:hypothetical protein
LIFAVISLGVPQAADTHSYLSGTQYWYIDSYNYYDYWEVYRYNFYTGTWYFWYGWGYDDIAYGLGYYGTYKAFLLISHGYELSELWYMLDYTY